jgi:glyoxylase-like metal-dependent hydrolase (beta-lactamase superfamily II)
MMTRQLFAALLTALCAAAWPGMGRAQQNFDTVEVHTLQVRDSIYMLVGAGGNITVQVGDDGVLIVDTQFAPLSDKILAAIRDLSDQPLRYIVNTHHHGDHTGGNAELRLAGSTVTGANVAATIADSGVGAQIIAHENVLVRLSSPDSDGQTSLPFDGWPTNTFFGEKKDLFFNGEGVRVIHLPAAHTDGDSIVAFRRSDVIAVGDVFSTTNYPVIDLAGGGSFQGVIDAVNRVIDMMIPVYGQDGGTLVIPGHGRLSNIGDVLNYREMITIIRDRVQHMIDAGMTLEQVKAARPTRDYDPRYGSSEGFWTTERFVEAAYQSLSEQPRSE